MQILEGGAATPKLIIRLGKAAGANSSATSDAPNNAPAADNEDDNQQQASSDNKDNRVGPPPPEPAKEETGVYSMEGGIDEKQPTDPNVGATAPRNIRSAKVTPIRLKLTRCQEGYELKDPVVASSASVDDGGGSGNNTSATTTVTLMNSAAPLPIGGAEQEMATAVVAMERLPAPDVAIPVIETRAEQEEQQPPCMDKQSSKDDIPLLPHRRR